MRGGHSVWGFGEGSAEGRIRRYEGLGSIPGSGMTSANFDAYKSLKNKNNIMKTWKAV